MSDTQFGSSPNKPALSLFWRTFVLLLLLLLLLLGGVYAWAQLIRELDFDHRPIWLNFAHAMLSPLLALSLLRFMGRDELA